jgi:hypothetical protein
MCTDTYEHRRSGGGGHAGRSAVAAVQVPPAARAAVDHIAWMQINCTFHTKLATKDDARWTVLARALLGRRPRQRDRAP